MDRLPDWRARLTDYVAAHARDPFSYGRLDCALFCAGAVEVMTGQDLARGWRGYRSLNEGRKKLAEKGFADQVDLVASLFPEVPVAFAQAGDIAAVPGDDDVALGIVQGEAVYVLRPPVRDGSPALALVPLLSAVRAFRV